MLVIFYTTENGMIAKMSELENSYNLFSQVRSCLDKEHIVFGDQSRSIASCQA